ncbi:MAG: immunity 8 family protein [Blastomonas sp.]|nr:immunity 8 family protein [Blastomonas sp.]
MRAELKSLSSVDVDLETYRPHDEAFCIEVTAEIGPLGEIGAEMFQFRVCSPGWLAKELESDAIVSGRHRFFMSQFRYDALEAYVLKRVRQAEGSDWPSVAEKLARWGYWEFEDYQV